MSTSGIDRKFPSLIEIIESISKAYEVIRILNDLPEAFHGVSKGLTTVENIFRAAKLPAKHLQSADSEKLKNRLTACEKSADKLQEIFEKVGKESKNGYDASVYRLIAVKLGKKRVETLMEDILEDAEVLVAHPEFQEVMQEHIEPLAEAKGELAKVSPSLPESEMNDSAGTINQYGNNNRQYNASGSAVQKNIDGNNYESGRDQHIGMIPPKDVTGGKTA